MPEQQHEAKSTFKEPFAVKKLTNYGQLKRLKYTVNGLAM